MTHRHAMLTVLALLTPLAAGRAGAEPQPLERPFDYFAGTDSWSCIGLKDYPRGTRATPDQELLLDAGTRVAFLLGKGLEPIPRSVAKTLWRGYLPAVQWGVRDSRDDRYSVRAFAAPLPGGSDEDARWSWPGPDGNYANVVQVAGPSRGRAAIRLLAGKPLDFRWETLASGLVRATSGGKTWLVASAAAKATPGADPGTLSLTPGRQPVALWLPSVPLADDAALLARAGEDPSGEKTLARMAAFWDGFLARGVKLEVPEQKVMDTYRASLIYQLIGCDLGEVHAGEGFYDCLFLRDGSYQLWSLALAGYPDQARKSLECIRRTQAADGGFTQFGELDAHGYALWAFCEHYWITRDREWLRGIYPQVRRAVAWLQQARRKEGDPASPFAGILPAAVADGENLWEGRGHLNHIIGYDFWSLRGLLCAVETALALDEPEDGAAWAREAAEYRAAIDRALVRAGTPWFPPSYEGEGTHWGDLECLFPTPLFEPDDPRVVATLDEVENRFGGGFVEGTIRWSPKAGAMIHPYMSQFVTNDEVVRGNQEQALEGFYSFLLHTTAAHAFGEVVGYRGRTAGEVVPHLWAAALYCLTLRNLLVREQGRDLHLSSAVPPHWLAPGRTLRIEGAPTRFGPMSAVWRARGESVTLELDPPKRNPPERILVHLPPSFRILSATCDAGRAEPDAGAVLLPAGARWLEVHVRRDKAPRLEYESVVRDYLSRPDPYARLRKSLVKLPLEQALPTEQCAFLDLAPAATTDPSKAPFNVPNPGACLFTGLQTGVVTVGGVPFRILDPAANGGRGLVVLNGMEACASLPADAVIPVHRRARRAFFLGNVTGWAPADPGAGDLGAVAEYDICYADGSTQTVPLVSGITADDWASPPAATDAYPGLRGTPWHLNVLGVLLQNKEIAGIRFRDAGTPASPVLAAVTLVR